MKDFSLYPLLLPQLASDALQNVPFCSGERGLQGHTLLAAATRTSPQLSFQPFPSTPTTTMVGKRSNEHATFRKFNKIEIFFVFFPPIFGLVAQISVPGGQTILGQICKFHEQFEE